VVPSGVHAAACWCVEPVGVRGAACWCRLVHSGGVRFSTLVVGSQFSLLLGLAPRRWFSVWVWLFRRWFSFRVWLLSRWFSAVGLALADGYPLWVWLFRRWCESVCLTLGPARRVSVHASLSVLDPQPPEGISTCWRAGVAGPSATMREGGSSARGGTDGCLAAVSGLAVRCVGILRDVARAQRVQLAVARWGLGACGWVCGRRARPRGVRRRGEWDSGSGM
jgi:hypothetical protein